MKTSLDELQLIESCLLGQASGGQQALFEAKLLLDSELGEDAYWQRKTYGIIRECGRKQLRNELEQIHQVLFSSPQHQSFRDKVLRFFRK